MFLGPNIQNVLKKDKNEHDLIMIPSKCRSVSTERTQTSRAIRMAIEAGTQSRRDREHL